MAVLLCTLSEDNFLTSCSIKLMLQTATDSQIEEKW